MKFILFKYDKYYPGQGADQIVGIYHNLKEAKESAFKVDKEGYTYDYYQIFRIDTGSCIEASLLKREWSSYELG